MFTFMLLGTTIFFLSHKYKEMQNLFVFTVNGKRKYSYETAVITSMLYDLLMANISRLFWAAATAIVSDCGFLVLTLPKLCSKMP